MTEPDEQATTPRWGLTGQDWTLDDVELVAQAIMCGQVAMETVDRLGPFPPVDYLRALRERVLELMEGAHRVADGGDRSS